MKIFSLFLFSLISVLITGCAASVSQTAIPDCTTKSCYTEIKGRVTAGGGGRAMIGGITVVGKDGSQNFRPLVDGVFPDRIDTLMPSAIIGFAQYMSADRHARGIERASRRSSPGQVFVLAPEGGSASATTEVGVISNQVIDPVHLCSTCGN